MDKPIPEAVLDRLAHEAYQVHCDTPTRAFPNDTHWPKWRAVVQHVADALTAAQQQGQAVYQVRMFGPFNAWIPVSKGEYDKAEGDKQIVYTAAPPSAPVGVEVKILARDVHYAIRDDGLAPASPADDAAMRNAILRVLASNLAQQPAAVDEPDVALLISMATCLNHGFGLLDAARQQAMLNDMRKLWAEVVGIGYYSPTNRERYLATQHQEPTT